MLKKADLNLTRKGKQLAEHPTYSHHNKENHCTRSLLEPLDDSHCPSEATKHKQDLSHAGSTLISPTFQSIPQLSLKDQLYRQDPSLSYINVNFSLKEAAKQADGRMGKQEGRVEEEVAQLKQQLLDHYKSKKYWSKINALFENDNVDAVLAWQESIEQYRKVKADREHLQTENEQLMADKEQILAEKDQLAERVSGLERQLLQDRNQTKVLSVKKCKGCESLEQKEKDYQQLYGQSRRSAKQLEEAKQATIEAQEQLRKLQEKHSHLGFLKEELEKKNGKLLDRERELSAQLQRAQQSLQGVERALQQDCQSSKELHLLVEKLKEEKYQMEKALAKNEEKQRREMSDLRLEMSSIQQQRDILAAQGDKMKAELAEARSKLFKVQFQVQGMEESLKLKTIQCQDQKKRHIDAMAEEMRRRNSIQDQLANKQEELKKAYQLLDEAENARLGLDVQLTHLRKASEDTDDNLQLIQHLQQRIHEQEEQIRQQEERIREAQESEHRIREADHRKNGMSLSLHGTHSSSPHGSLLARVCQKIKEIHCGLIAGQDNPDSYNKRRVREERQEDTGLLKNEVSLLRTERQVNEISTELANLRNKYQYVLKENDTLKTQLQQEVEQLQAELDHCHHEIDIKEEALKTVVFCIPENLKEDVLELLCITERLAEEYHDVQTDVEEYQEQKAKLEERAKEWKQQWSKAERRIRRLEEEARRLEEQNEQLRRKNKPEPKRLVTEYDYKKDIRKKYNM